MKPIILSLARFSLAVLFTLAAGAPAFANDHHVHSSKPVPLSATERAAADQQYARWLPEFRRRAFKAGIDAALFDRVMTNVQVDPVVLEKDRWQPERTRTFVEYENAQFSHLIGGGIAFMKNHDPRLDGIAEQYGVPLPLLAALNGIESGFGADEGSYSLVRSLATLAAAGRPGQEGKRQAQFDTWLLTTLRLIQKGAIGADATGSWAACEGMFQFSPDDYVAHSVDADGDGRADIWHDKLDAFASAAKKLRDDGYRPGMGWGERVSLPPGFNVRLTGYSGGKQDKRRTIGEWRRLGVHDIGGAPLSGRADEEVEIIAPGSDRKGYAGGPVFLARHNFDVLMRWNQSSYFVATILEAGDRIAAQTAIAAGTSPQ